MNTCLNLDALREQFLRDHDGYSFRHLSGYSTKILINKDGKDVSSDWRLYMLKNSNIIISSFKTYVEYATEELKGSWVLAEDRNIRYSKEPVIQYTVQNEDNNVWNAECFYNNVCAWEKEERAKLDKHMEKCRELKKIRMEEHEKRRADALKEIDDYKNNMINGLRKICEGFCLTGNAVVSIFGEVTENEIVAILAAILPLKGGRHVHRFAEDTLLYYRTLNKFASMHNIRVEDAEKVLSEYCDRCIKECK
jgi:hypothetical protein